MTYKVKAIISKVVKITLCTLLGILSLAAAVLMLLYSPWAQENIRQALIENLRSSDGSTSLSLDELSLRFPLSLSLKGLVMTQDHDTIVAAQSADIDVELLPLLGGDVRIDRAHLTNAIYRSGSPDSATYMNINAGALLLQPASVRLSDMDINLDNGHISDGRFEMVINPDTATTSSSDTLRMKIRLGALALDNFTFAMRMMPSIDTLSANIASATLSEGEIDLAAQTIRLNRFAGSGLDTRYIAPDSASIAAGAPYPVSTDTTSTSPWTIAIDTILFERSKALYTTAGTIPQPGLDFGYISLDSMTLELCDFYNRASDVRLPINISGTERSGVKLNTHGTLDISGSNLTFKSFTLSTADGSNLSFSGLMGMGDMTSDPTVPLSLNAHGSLSASDLAAMFPAFNLYWNSLPNDEPVTLDTDIDGTSGSLDIKTLDIAVTRFASLGASGTISDMMNPERMAANIGIDGRIGNIGKLRRALMPDATGITIPPLTMKGTVRMQSGNISGNLAAFTNKGAVRLNALWKSHAEDYRLTLHATDFPVNAFMPDGGVGRVSADITANGHGYDIFSPETRIEADADIATATYSGHPYKNINARARIADGHADINLTSADPDAELKLSASGNLTGEVYKWNLTADGSNINLQALKMSSTPATVEVTLGGDAEIGPGSNDISGKINLHDLFFRQESGTIALSDVGIRLNACDSLTDIAVDNRDMTLNFGSPRKLTDLLTQFSNASDALAAQMAAYSIRVDTLQHMLPPFRLNIDAGPSNMLNDILASSDMSFRKLKLNAKNDSAISLGSTILSFKTGETRLDTITFGIGQHNEHMHLKAHVGNRPGTFDAWKTVDLTGKLDHTSASLALHQANRKGATGFDLGIETTVADSVATLRLVPYSQIIGYKPWSINDDNFIRYDIADGHIDANLHMSGSGSSIALYTEHVPGETHHAQEDLIIRLSDIHIADWVSLNPFAPPMKGDLSADMRLNRQDGQLLGNGEISVDNFFYDRQPVASLKANFDVATMAGGAFKANADLYVDGQKTITVGGVLNDSVAASPLNLDFSMIRFPLATVNPFLGASTGRLRGMMNGTLKISGKSEKPVYNGYLDFDSTAFKLTMTGTEYTFSEVHLPVENNVVSLDNFEITGCNRNPLSISGEVDLNNMSDARFNLNLKADNMQIVNSRRAAKGADVYGKAFITLDANARGSMSLMWLDANLTLGSGTNVTYVIPDATSVLESQSTGEMVKFVNFTDSAAVAAADSVANTGMAMFVNALLNIESGSTINVDLSSTGSDKVQLQSNGTLNYTSTPVGEGRLSGRIAIDQGFIRYTPPFMSEKLFNFQEGSYVAFNGNMMNPTLNIRAIDDVKANVTQEGQNSRLINFDVILTVNGTMNNMNAGFDLATNDDITVANELQSMSAEQRANQAMNLLLYNVYTGPGTKGNASLSGNPLFSFLESQINSWAANNIRGVDISFGIDQYDRTVNGSTAQTTSYSYQVSKSLFNDRFKIIIGGNYSTDANADENFSQNLINDISFEYFLNNSRSMYVRLFRHTGYESILEGEITQTGVGFVYRRKLLRLSDMFRFRKTRPSNVEPQTENVK